MEPIEPYDPMCGRYAKDMPELDNWLESDQTRATFVIENEGTYNTSNGHFLCDSCYVKAGFPTSPGYGWVCP
jgi:hypothetical protein